MRSSIRWGSLMVAWNGQVNTEIIVEMYDMRLTGPEAMVHDATDYFYGFVVHDNESVLQRCLVNSMLTGIRGRSTPCV